MRIVVPVIASYPDRRGCIRNLNACRAQGHVVNIDKVILKKGREKKWDALSDPQDRANFLLSVDSSPCLVVPATGGMGTIRTLSAMKCDWNRWAAFKTAVGFSDTTAFAVKVAAHSKLPSYHGPCFEDKEFMTALPYYLGEKTDWEIPYTFIDGGSAKPLDAYSAPIWGGNLTLFGYMMADPHVRKAVNVTRKILFFEDIFDPVIYRDADTTELLEMEFDRLEYCGLFENVIAILLGRITGKRRSTVMKFLRHYYKGVVIGVDIGHKEKNKGWALMPPIPLGVRVDLFCGENLKCDWGGETNP